MHDILAGFGTLLLIACGTGVLILFWWTIDRILWGQNPPIDRENDPMGYAIKCNNSHHTEGNCAVDCTSCGSCINYSAENCTYCIWHKDIVFDFADEGTRLRHYIDHENG